MKKVKKIAALFLAVVMIMAMGMTAMAAGNNSIIIKGAIDGVDYTAYKIFNVTTTTGGASYTRPAKNADGTKAAQLAENTDLFTQVDNGGANVYYNPVSDIDSKASELEAYLKAAVDSGLALSSVTSAEAANKTVTISGLEPGYYYVVNNGTGNKAMLRVVEGEEPTVITEKDTVPGWGDNGGKKALNADGDEDAFYAIGETITYEITYGAAQNYRTVTTTTDNGDGTTTTTTTTDKVWQYVAEDTMKTGLELQTGTFKVEVKEAGADAAVEVKPAAEDSVKGYKGTVGTNGFNIQIPWAASQSAANVEDFHYKGVPAEIKITYEVKVMADVNAGVPVTNMASIRPNNDSRDTTNTDTVDVYTGSVTIQKFDSQAGNFDNATAGQKLAGAVFKIYRKTEAGAREYLAQNETTKEIAWGAEDAATEFTTGSDGTITVSGLDQGTYYLKETAAPAGYNALEDTEENEELRSFTIAKDGSTETAALVMEKEVGNSTGAVLPSTGGIGTTIFYVVGGILVVGAAVLLITKKRMNAHN